ncbi:MAG TPA: 50S ribosomal protein L31 [Anaeromyxobacteraceae bacterium]|nr:50S ribosomal protein L31 [Anaeromyxobacteraceae bacterium]
MREGIHPDYKAAKVVCACGNVIDTRSTRGDFHIEICSACHPFFTGKQKILDTAGRIERFKTRYAAQTAAPAKAEAKPAAPKAEAKKADAAKENRAAKRAKANAGKPKPKAEPSAEAKPAETAPAQAAAEPKA